MSDTMKALDEIEAALKPFASVLRNNGELYEPDWITRDDCKSAARALSLLPTLRAALVPPADDEIEAIRARHTDIQEVYGNDGICPMGQRDRATLLRALDAERQRRVEVEGWQPIETAPKDGRRVLAWAKEWSDPLTVQYYGMWWGAYYELGPLKHQPTDWMPLPTPPATLTKETP